MRLRRDPKPITNYCGYRQVVTISQNNPWTFYVVVETSRVLFQAHSSTSKKQKVLEDYLLCTVSAVQLCGLLSLKKDREKLTNKLKNHLVF